MSRFILEELLYIKPIIFNLPVKVAEDLLIFVSQAGLFQSSALIAFSIISGGVAGVLIQVSRQHIHEYFKNLSTKFLIIFPLIVGIFIAFLAQSGSDQILGDGGHLLEDILYNHDTTTIFDFVGKYLNCILSLAIGCAGGVVIPSLALGALFGDVAAGIFSVSAPFMIMLCTASFLSSVIKAPLTTASFIIIFTKLDLNLAIYVIITAYLSCYFSLGVQRIIGCKAL